MPIIFSEITFTHDKEKTISLKLHPKTVSMKRHLHLRSQRDLTPIGKITVVKTLGLFQLVFLLQVLPNPPLHFINQIKVIIFDFI